MRPRPAGGLVMGLLLAACGGGSVETVTAVPAVAPATTLPARLPDPPPPASAPLEGLRYQQVAAGLRTPVFAATPAGDDRIFILEKAGAIRVVADGRLADEPYLDLEPFVGSEGNEQGLVGLAFHPQFDDNRRFFVYYTNRSGDSRVVEFAASDDPLRASPVQGRVILSVAQPHEWHNGGMLAFGPDGYLWVSLGDGGGVGDKYGQGQQPDTLLASILKIDVNAGPGYAVPPDNPFVDGGGAREVWGFGLRNPYRFSFDHAKRTIYIGDVGQFEWEEIDVASVDASGLNFGWPVREGEGCYEATSCPDEFTAPVVTYSHQAGCAVLAGPVYVGHAIPELNGHFFYADYCRGFINSFVLEDGLPSGEQSWLDDLGRRGRITGIGTDGAGELIVTTEEGEALRVVPLRK